MEIWSSEKVDFGGYISRVTLSAAHHVDKFGEVIPTGNKVIHPNTLKFAQHFEFWLPHIFFSVDTQMFGPNF